jgi:hypothetical protein
MELKMEDYGNSNLDTENNLNNNQVRYWDENKSDNQTNEKHKKKKVSFNDILRNMNLVVSNDGVLQYMTTNKESNNQINVEPQMDPSVKHSYIYNKYFKDYKDMNVAQQEPRKPKTIEELKQILREERIKTIQQKIRIQQIKPKHMLFTNAGGIQASKNSLYRMSFN